MNDHDLLTKLDQKITNICKNQTESVAANLKAHDAIMEKIEEQQKCIMNQSHKFVSSKLFFWLSGIIFIILIGLGTVAADNNFKFGEIETKIEYLINGSR